MHKGLTCPHPWWMLMCVRRGSLFPFVVVALLWLPLVKPPTKEPESSIQVFFFARAREIAGQSSLAISLPPGATVAIAAERLKALFPGLGEILSASRFALDEELVSKDQPVSGHAVLSVIPPVSGG